MADGALVETEARPSVPVTSAPQVAHGTPVKVTQQFSATVPAEQTPLGAAPKKPRVYEVHERHEDFIRWLEDHAEDPACANVYITIERVSPLPGGIVVGAEKRMSLLKMDALSEELAAKFGGGRYKIKVWDSGSVQHVGFIVLPTNAYPPKPLPNEALPLPEDPELAAKKRELEVAKLDREKRKMDREDADAEKARDTSLDKFLALLQADRATQRAEFDKQIAGLVTGLKEAVSPLMTARSTQADGQAQQQTAFLVEAIKSMQAGQQAFMTMMVQMTQAAQADKASGAATAAASSEKVAQMAIEMAKGVGESAKTQATELQKVLLEVLARRAAENPTKDALDLVKQGRNEAIEMVELMREIEGESRREAEAAGQAGEGGMSGMLARLAERVLTRVLSRPQHARLAERLSGQPVSAAPMIPVLPQPQVVPQMMAPQLPSPGVGPGMSPVPGAGEDDDTEPTEPLDLQSIPTLQARPTMPAPAAPASSLPPAQPAPQVNASSAGPAAWCNTLVYLMLKGTLAAHAAQLWGQVPPSLLPELAAGRGNNERLAGLIQKHADQNMWTTLITTATGNPAVYQQFLAVLGQMSEAAAKGVPPPAPAAPVILPMGGSPGGQPNAL